MALIIGKPGRHIAKADALVAHNQPMVCPKISGDFVIMNDAGIGKDNAGICGLEYLDQINLAAATADAQTCHIGDGDHMLEHGIISHVNRAATALGCSPGQSVRECAELMRSAIVPATAPPSFIEGARFVMREVPGEPAVICADSVGMLHPEDAGRIAITASHGALSGGRPDNAIPPAPVRAARPRARVHPVAHHATPGRRAQGCAVAGGQSRANSSLKPNSLLAGKIQGILFVWASECDYWLGIKEPNSRTYDPIPYASEQGIYFGLAGN